jgi:hypothetical protein
MNFRSNEGLVKSQASQFVTPKRIKIGTKGIPVVSIIRDKCLVIALMGSGVLRHIPNNEILFFSILNSILSLFAWHWFSHLRVRGGGLT